jgi:hypothetical protein
VQQRCRCQGAGAGQGAGAEAEAEAKAEAERVSRGANRTRNVSNATAARTLGGSWKGSRADVTACMCVGVCGWVVTRIQYTIHTLSIITSSHQPKKVTFHKIIRRAHMIRGGGPETPDGRGLEWTGLDSTQLNSTQLNWTGRLRMVLGACIVDVRDLGCLGYICLGENPYGTVSWWCLWLCL